jgi:threonine dehydrogenase-like Zn-dependent dehydrogenase
MMVSMAAVAGLPTHGRAAVVGGWGQPLEMRDYPLVPPGAGELVVRVECAAVCGSDVHAWDGALASSFAIDLPIVLGHETVGRVVALGEGADRDAVGTPLALGDRVVWAHAACGRCHECTVLGLGTLCPNRQIGFLRNAELAPHFHGGFAEYAHIPARSQRLRVPDDVKTEWAAAASCALRTIVDALERLGPVDYRHSIVVQGAGPLGLFATAMLALHSPRRIIVIGGPPDRLAVAQAWGADATIDIAQATTPDERIGLVQELTDGRGADVVCELSGARTAFAEGLAMAAPAGRYLVAGTVGGATHPVQAGLITRRNLTVIGSLGAEIDAYHKAMEVLRRHRDRFDWDLLIGGHYPLDEATTALRRMRDFSETKAVIVP